ncbi:MAG: DUF4160 domain-containing protein [Chitinophagales bacterium]|nr:DUF4160 domain-containing protein [Chitinophagales bacterium]
MRAIKGTNFNVYVYPEDHAPPHCHIRYKGQQAESLVGLPLLNLLAGPVPEKSILKTLQANTKRLMKLWEQLNPTSINQTEEQS